MTDFIVTRENSISTVISAETLPDIIISQGAASVINSIPAASVLASQAVILQSIISAEQGPPGISQVIQLIAPQVLGGNRAVTGALTYADSSDITTAGKVVGLTVGAADAGAPVNICDSGELGGFSGLIIDQPIYLGLNGIITQIAPMTGYCQRLGVAISATRILVNISEPIL